MEASYTDLYLYAFVFVRLPERGWKEANWTPCAEGLVFIRVKEEIGIAVREFVASFEAVFGTDWAYTKSMLGIRDETPEQTASLAALGLESIPTVSKEGTFIEPGIEDETEDWGHRGELLRRYRHLKQLMKSQ